MLGLIANWQLMSAKIMKVSERCEQNSNTIHCSESLRGCPGCASGKEPTCQCRRHKRCRFNPWVGKIPWRRAWQPIPVFLPRESHGHRSLVGYSPQGCNELDTTEAKQASKQARITWRFYSSEDANLVGLAGLLGDAVATGPSTYHSTPDRS